MMQSRILSCTDFQAKIKEAKFIGKVGNDLKSKVSQTKPMDKASSRNLNFKRPLARPQNYSSVGNRQYQSLSRVIVSFQKLLLKNY